jgi:hypothetical protein
MINVVCARGERYAARILTTSPKIIARRRVVCCVREREGRFDRGSFKHGVFQLRANFRRGKSEGAAMPESRGCSRDSVLTRVKTQPGERFQMNFL